MIPELGIILDAGTGIYRARDLIQTSELHVFLSHAHLDHCIGLTYFLDILFEKDVASLKVYGQRTKLEAIQKNLFAPDLFPVVPPIEWTPLASNFSLSLGAGCVSWTELCHPGGALGYRLDWPEFSLAFITDTTASQDAGYIDFIRDVDVLIHECNFPDGYENLALKTGHSCLTPVAQISRAANVGRTVLTHFNALDDSPLPVNPQVVHEIFASISLAEDQLVIEV